MSQQTTVNYGARTAFSSVANLDSLAAGSTAGIGPVDNSATGVMPGADGFLVDLSITLAATGVSATGTITVYLIQSQQSTTAGFTDGISPTATSATPVNATPIRVLNANANGQVVQDTFRLPVPDPAEFSGILISNGSGAALAATGHSANFTPFSYLTQ